MGAGFSMFMFFLFCSFGLALWYGSSRVIDGTLTGAQVFVSFIAMMMGKSYFLQKIPRANIYTI
jgi:hypothetical protein